MARILIRADATAAMGTGHVMRCLALVETLLSRGHECLFAMAETTPAIGALLAERAIAVEPLPGPGGSEQDLAALLALAADAIVIDGYHFNGLYRAGLAAAKCPVLAWDDGGPPIPLHATLVVNASSAARAEDYAVRAPAAQLLLGPAYLPLRREIRGLLGADRAAHGPLLLTFGGSDPLGLTGPVLLGLAPHLGGRIEAVLGGSVADPGPAEAAAAAYPDRIRLHRDTPRLGELMLAARLAVSAAGGTLAELAALKTPSILVAVADNQIDGARLSAGHGWCVALDGRAEDAVAQIVAATLALWADAPRRAAMTKAAVGLVDGGGPDRLADALEAVLANFTQT